MEFKYADGQLSISQEKYVNKLLTEFGMTQCKAVTTPMVPGKPVKSTKVCDMNYRKLIGGLLYIATNDASRHKLQCGLFIPKFKQPISNRLGIRKANSSIPERHKALQADLYKHGKGEIQSLQ